MLEKYTVQPVHFDFVRCFLNYCILCHDADNNAVWYKLGHIYC